MSSAATGNSSAFEVSGGPLRIHVALPDTTSADGDFTVLLCSTPDGTYIERGAYDERDQATLTKTAGSALVGELVIQSPAATWGRLRYDRDAGGAASEITAIVQAFE